MQNGRWAIRTVPHWPRGGTNSDRCWSPGMIAAVPRRPGGGRRRRATGPRGPLRSPGATVVRRGVAVAAGLVGPVLAVVAQELRGFVEVGDHEGLDGDVAEEPGDLGQLAEDVG